MFKYCWLYTYHLMRLLIDQLGKKQQPQDGRRGTIAGIAGGVGGGVVAGIGSLMDVPLVHTALIATTVALVFYGLMDGIRISAPDKSG